MIALFLSCHDRVKVKMTFLLWKILKMSDLRNARLYWVNVLFGLILYVPSTIFQLNRDGFSWVEPILS